MSDEERKIMEEHVQHWRSFMNRGMAYVFGPVFDPKGAYDFSVVSLERSARYVHKQ
jgi:uncharacterized protein